jgi:hypothetical protein
MVDYLQDQCRANRSAVLFVYFDYQDRFNQNAIQVLRMLLKQIIAQSDLIPSSIVDLYEECTSRDRPLDLSDILEQFTSCCRHFDSVYVLFDAFDECDDSQQEQIRSLIEELLLLRSLRVMLTSRPYLRALQNLSETAIVIPISAQDPDVREFLVSRLDGAILPQALKSELVDTVAQGAEGMYLPLKSALKMCQVPAGGITVRVRFE